MEPQTIYVASFAAILVAFIAGVTVVAVMAYWSLRNREHLEPTEPEVEETLEEITDRMYRQKIANQKLAIAAVAKEEQKKLFRERKDRETAEMLERMCPESAKTESGLIVDEQVKDQNQKTKD